MKNKNNHTIQKRVVERWKGRCREFEKRNNSKRRKKNTYTTLYNLLHIVSKIIYAHTGVHKVFFKDLPNVISLL